MFTLLYRKFIQDNVYKYQNRLASVEDMTKTFWRFFQFIVYIVFLQSN